MSGTVKSIDAEPLEHTSGGSRVFQDGVVAGVIGAATVALWFLVRDTLNGRPLYPPTVLGNALLRQEEGLASLASLPISLEMVLMVAWVHGPAFAMLGGVSWLLSVAATMGGFSRLRHPNMRVSP